MVMGMGSGDLDWSKIVGGNLGIGNFGQLTGAGEQDSSGTIWGNQENESETGDSFTSSGMMGNFDMSNIMGGMSGMMGNFDMSNIMGGMSGMSGMSGISGMSGMMGNFDMSNMMSGMSGMSGMMGGMSGMGDMSSMITGFIDLIINFFEGLKNLFSGGTAGEETGNGATEQDAQAAVSDPETYWNEQADLTGEAVSSIKDEENIKDNTAPETEGELADKDEELKSFIDEFTSVDITEEATTQEQAAANAQAIENLYNASQSAETIRKHFGENLTDEQVAQIGAEIRSYIEKVAPNKGDVSFDGDSENNFLLTGENELNPDYE